MAANQAQSTSKALVRLRMIRPTTITMLTITMPRRRTPASVLCDHGRPGPSGPGTRQTLPDLPGIFGTRRCRSFSLADHHLDRARLTAAMVPGDTRVTSGSTRGSVDRPRLGPWPRHASYKSKYL